MDKKRDIRAAVMLLKIAFVLLLCACGGSQPGPMPAIPSEVAPPLGPETPPPLGVPQGGWGRGQRPPSAPFQVYTDPGELPEIQVAADRKTKLPLEHTHISARLTGFFAEVEVSQTYKNPFDKPIEVVYIFPLPENSTVDRMKMVIGARVIEAEIKERKEAKRTYEAAKRQGYTAALLEQERSNIFTQSVANIEPGKKIDVVIHYLQDLTYDAGEYEFVFPMVVGPRYIGGAPKEGAPSGAGTYQDTDRVKDASRITPPVVGKGERSGHDISLELVADAFGVVGDFETPTHAVLARRPADGTLRLTLAEKDSLPNRDFVLRYRVAGPEPSAALFTGAGKGGGFFSLVIQPPALNVDELVGRRELIFVVDVSGSMSGVPLSLCKAAMREAITRVRPVDTFNIITFSGSTGKAFPSPRPANNESVADGLRYIDKVTAGGGTEMLDAIATALSPDVEKGRHRYVFFLTDGFVGDDDRIVASSRLFADTLEAKGQRARVFGFGVGSSPNRSLLEGLSRAGRGIAVYASNREDPLRGVNRFYRYIDSTVLKDVKVDWGDYQPSEVFPAEIPDLFASHPLILHGRYQGGGPKPVVVRGMAGDTPVEIRVTARASATADAPPNLLGALWARSKVGSLEEALWQNQNPDAEREITELGLDFHIVTRFTSFVAVDRSRKVGDGNPETIVQPVEAPEDVDADMAGARPIVNVGSASRSFGSLESAQVVVAGYRRPGCACRVGEAAAGEKESREAFGAFGLVAVAISAWARRRRI
jgi:Ca-activated chloride channel family protein